MIKFVIWGIAGLFFLVMLTAFWRWIRDKNLLKSVTKKNRGTGSERDLALKLLKYGLPPESIFHDLYIRNVRGNFSQIDLVAVTEVGIIVFEVKDYSGWIFGNGMYDRWTQVLAYGREKYRFYNPIKQNNKHIAILRKQLIQFNTIPFYSVVVFYGNCELKDITFVPKGTYIVKSTMILKVMKIIFKENEPVRYFDRKEIFRVLKEAVQNGENKTIRQQHIENIKDMLGEHRVFG